MYYITAATVIAFLILGIVSRKEKTPEKGILGFFCRLSAYLYKKLHIWKNPIIHSSQVCRDLEKLYPGESSLHRQTEFFIRKLGMAFAVLFLGTVISTGVKWQASGNRMISKNSTIVRTDYGQREEAIQMEAQIPGKFQGIFELKVPMREMEKEEADILVEQFWNELCVEALGENLSAEQVETNLQLKEELAEYPFAVNWTSCRPEVISRNGRVSSFEAEEVVELEAVITYGELEWNRSLVLTVHPPQRTEAETIYWEIEKMLKETEEASHTKKEWNLPGEWSGQEIFWEEVVEENSLLLWFLTLAAAIGIYFLSDKDVHKQLEERRRQMRAAYPLIVNKMVLYLGAGMSVRGAYKKMAQDYQARKEENGVVQPAYEEMLYTCHQLDMGTSDGKAFEHFGRRSGLQEYVKLAALLTQNIKKGNQTLLERLREEANVSMQLRIQYRRQAGEEAGTKLLLPMVIMLGVIMIMIILPAFTSFNI